MSMDENKTESIPSRLLSRLKQPTAAVLRNRQDSRFRKEYKRWLNAHNPSSEELAFQRKASKDASLVFSIVVPLFNTPLSFFNDMVASVKEQSYESWQLILVNASPDNAALSAGISRIQTDGRITVITLDENKGIIGNTSAGTAAATGDFICFLDHDDTLAPNALFEYAHAIQQNPVIDVLHCDEDKLSEDGSEYLNPYFKPDYSPHLLRCFNYITHFLCVRASLYKQLEPPRLNVEGAQDYDLVLKATEKAREVYHSPRVLYHWRISEKSTADDPAKKDYADEAGRVALQGHLDRMKLSAVAELTDSPCIYRVDYRVPKPEPKVSILIGSWKSAESLQDCLDSLRKTSYPNFEIVVVNSKDHMDDSLIESYLETTVLVSSDNDSGEVERMNRAAHHASGDFLLFFNEDLRVVQDDWLERMVGIALEDKVGIVGCTTASPKGIIFHTGITLAPSSIKYVLRGHDVLDAGAVRSAQCDRDFSAVSIDCLLCKNVDFKDCGGLDKDLAPEYAGIDLCLNMRESDKLVVNTPQSKLEIHLRTGQTADLSDKPEFDDDLSALIVRWSDFFSRPDPYDNINLSNF